MSKSLGQIAFEGAFKNWLPKEVIADGVTTDPEAAWLEQNGNNLCLEQDDWEAAAQAVRKQVIEECKLIAGMHSGLWDYDTVETIVRALDHAQLKSAKRDTATAET